MTAKSQTLIVPHVASTTPSRPMDEGVSSAVSSLDVGEPSRRRIVGAFAVVTLAPVAFAVLFVENAVRWHLKSEWAAGAWIAAAAILARGLSVPGRWLTIGPGRVVDRRIWGWFLLLSSAALIERLCGFATGFAAAGYAFACMMFWNLSRRDVPGISSESTKNRFTLGDAIVALVLFSVLAWVLGSGIDWRRSGTLAGASGWAFSLPFISFPALIAYLADAAFRDVALRPERRGRGTLQSIASVAAALLSICCLALATRENVHVLLAPPIFVSVYALTAVAQESALAWAGIGAGEAPVHSSIQTPARERTSAAQMASDCEESL